MAGHTHFDESTEEYLEAIYRLDREGPGVTTSGIASELGVAPASVSGMLKKLSSEGFIDHQARGGAKLTKKGLEIAVRVIRRNRLAECLLTQVLGMAWDEVHTEACRLEHAISSRVEERLVAVFGESPGLPARPSDPAARSDRSAAARHPARADLARRVARVVHGVTEEVPEILRYLGEIGSAPRRQGRSRSRRPRSAVPSRSESIAGGTRSRSNSRARSRSWGRRVRSRGRARLIFVPPRALA